MNESFKILWLRFKPLVSNVAIRAIRLLGIANTLISIYILFSIIYAFGFNVEYQNVLSFSIYNFFYWSFLVESIIVLIHDTIIRKIKDSFTKIYIYSILFLFGILLLLPQSIFNAFPFLGLIHQWYISVTIVAIEALVKISIVITRSLSGRISPNLIFVGSFLTIILLGMCLLLLPRACHGSLSVIDALFTSVSTVCVTGLATIDYATDLTFTGQVIILLLLQLGGIGIMTFTSFFGLIISTKLSSRNSLMLKDLIDPNNSLSQIFTTLRNIIAITISIEAIGTYMIFSAIGDNTTHGLFTAVFHSVSAFCNAGISTIPNGFSNPDIADNYLFLNIVSIIVILGGLGFPILFNLWQWLKNTIINHYRRYILHNPKFRLTPHILTSSTVIVLSMTTILLFGGIVFFLVSEHNNILHDKNLTGRLSTALFLAVTPRSAGFNTFDPAALTPPSLIFMSLLMWIGASPMSTGGGIKTTTIAIAALNVWNTLRGRDSIEIRHRTISHHTVNRTYIIIFVSIIIISFSSIALLAIEPDIPPRNLVFEVLSAFSTVGLSMGVTASLSTLSKILIIIVMFTGRIGLLTLLGCFIHPKQAKFYAYPSETIQIN